ncbi:MAG: AAA family ATPase [Nanoarchaeota archaeon]
MSDLFKDILHSDESLFLNPQFLDSDFIPPIIKFRENEQQYIAQCIKPILMKRDGKNLLIKGSPGIGKTLASRHVLSELKKDSNDVFCVYVNCWKKDSSFKILNEMCSQLNYKYVFNKSFDVLMKDICALINEKSLVIVLDEIDRLTDNTILYSLLEDIYRKSIIMITNDDEFLSSMDARIKSRMIPETLEFKTYNANEIDSILRERAEYAFVKNVMDDECFELISEKTFEFKDLRTGLFLLKESGEVAESLSSRKITPEHTMKALEKLNASIIKEVNDDNKDVIDLIKLNSGKTTAEIFKEYESKYGKSYRTFQRKIKDLEKMNIITLKELNKGREGRSTVVEFNQKMLADY